MATVKDVLAVAVKELGTKEHPANSNRVVYNTWYYGKEVSGSAYPWCMAFVQWCFAQAGMKLPLKTASCGVLLRWYQSNAPERVFGADEAQPGDIAIFDFPGGAATDHTGIVESVGPAAITTIDGNTGANEINGGAVLRRTRSRSVIRAVIRPAYDPEKTTEQEESDMETIRYQTIEEIKAKAPWAEPTIRKLVERGALLGDEKGLNLSYDLLRMLVINDRMGLYK